MSAQDVIAWILGFLTTGGAGAFVSWQVALRRARQKQLEEDEQRAREIAQLQAMRDEIVRLKAASIPPPAARESRQAAARAAGFAPGETGSFERANSIGEMRCNAHDEMMRRDADTKTAADRATEASERAMRAAEALQSAVAAAAASASVASAAAAQLEEAVRRENQQTREAIGELTDLLGNLREWKGAIEARTSALEREMGSVRRGIAAGAGGGR